MRDRYSLNPESTRTLLHRWFVRYNPLYFFSALCVLGGVFLCSRGLGEPNLSRERLFLALTVQAYELLLLAGAALLHRKAKQTRPAVILAVLEVFFLFDWTFQTEVFAAMKECEGLYFAPVWLVLAALKLGALVWIFRLRPSLSACALAFLGLVGLGSWPQLIQVLPDHCGSVHLAATWFGAMLAALAVLLPPRVVGTVPFGRWGRTVLRRGFRAFWAVGAGFYLVHLAGWAVQFSTPLTWAHAVPFILLSALMVRREAVAWGAALVAVLVALLVPATLWFTALGAAAMLTVMALRLKQRRLWSGMVLAAEIAAWTLGWSGGPAPEAVIWLHVAAALVLAVMALRWRMVTPGLASALALLPVARTLRPETPLEWGITLLAAGFLALILGVALNWDRRAAGGDDAQDPPQQEPGSGPRPEPESVPVARLLGPRSARSGA
jgi:hypothetical protein